MDDVAATKGSSRAVFCFYTIISILIGTPHHTPHSHDDPLSPNATYVARRMYAFDY